MEVVVVVMPVLLDHGLGYPRSTPLSQARIEGRSDWQNANTSGRPLPFGRRNVYHVAVPL